MCMIFETLPLIRNIFDIIKHKVLGNVQLDQSSISSIYETPHVIVILNHQ